MSTMGCEETLDLLPLFVGGDLPREKAGSLAGHVAGCPSCARELDLYRESRTGLLSLRAEEAPEGTFGALRAVVERELFPRRRPKPGISWPDEVLRHAAVLMVGLAVGVGGYAVLRSPAPAPVAAAERPSVRPEFVGTVPGRAVGRVFLPDLAAPPPPIAPDHRFYLPRVDVIPAGGERDF